MVSAPGARLAVRGLEAGWDRVPVVRGLDLDVGAGEIVAVLGPNGAGKSTLLWALAGLVRARRGSVSVDGRRLDGVGAEGRAARGVWLLPQAIRVFPSLTVAENLDVVELGTRPPDPSASRRFRDGWLERFPVLGTRLNQPAASLSGGEQQLLAIGRVLSASPRVLLLDEPSAGLSPARAGECARAFAEAAAGGAAVVMVEQNVALAAALASRSLRMQGGALVDLGAGAAGPAAAPAQARGEGGAGEGRAGEGRAGPTGSMPRSR